MPDIASLGLLFGFLVLVGGVAGIISGLLGVGGGIVLVPAFFYMFSALGYQSAGLMQVCVATSLATIIVTSARSVMAHHKKGAVDWVMLKQWALPIAIGSVAGVVVVSHLHTHTLQIIFGTMLLLIAAYMIVGKASWRISDNPPSALFRAWFAPLMGFMSVLLGIGGGSIGTPMQTLHNIPIHRAGATSSGFGVVVAIPSAVGFLLTHVENAPPYTLGAVNTPAFLVVIAVSVITAPWGAALAHRLPARQLKIAFAVFLMLIALNMLRKALF